MVGCDMVPTAARDAVLCPPQSEVIWRFAVTLPAVKLLSSINATRRLVFGLIGSLPEHYPFFALLAVILYTYDVVGVRTRLSLSKQVPRVDPMAPRVLQVLAFGGLMSDSEGVTFNSSVSGLGALLQILTGESWHQIMYRAVDAVDNIGATIYFISLVSLVLLLFANVFIGARRPPWRRPHSCHLTCAARIRPVLSLTAAQLLQASLWTRSKSLTTRLKRAKPRTALGCTCATLRPCTKRRKLAASCTSCEACEAPCEPQFAPTAVPHAGGTTLKLHHCSPPYGSALHRRRQIATNTLAVCFPFQCLCAGVSGEMGRQGTGQACKRRLDRPSGLRSPACCRRRCTIETGGRRRKD